MNPFGLTVTGLLVWGIVAHLIADWPLQNDWMARNKASRRRFGKPLSPVKRRRERRALERGCVVSRRIPWWDRHPAAYVHAGIHGLLLAPVFGWPAAVLALAHLVIDTRWPVEGWSRLMRQTQPTMTRVVEAWAADPEHRPYSFEFDSTQMSVRFVDEKGTEFRGGEPVTEVTVLTERVDRLMSDMREWTTLAYSLGMEVRIWTDQVFHVACVAVAALVVGAAT